MTDDLVQFLRTRLDEDERAARDAGGKPWAWEQHYGDMCNDPTCEYGELATDDTVLMDVHGYDVKAPWQGADHIARHDPARVLAEVDAKRQVVEMHGQAHECVSYDWVSKEINTCMWVDADEVCTTLRLLALPYADHPDYREEWRPDPA